MDTPAAPPAAATPAPRTTRILRTLVIVSFDALEPVFLAALATETPPPSSGRAAPRRACCSRGSVRRWASSVATTTQASSNTTT
jgi:hypothetical protein